MWTVNKNFRDFCKVIQIATNRYVMHRLAIQNWKHIHGAASICDAVAVHEHWAANERFDMMPFSLKNLNETLICQMFIYWLSWKHNQHTLLHAHCYCFNWYFLFLWFKFNDEMIDLLTWIECTHGVDIMSRAVNASIWLSDSSYVFNKRYLFILFSSTSVHEMFSVDVVAVRVHSTNGKFQFWTFDWNLCYWKFTSRTRTFSTSVCGQVLNSLQICSIRICLWINIHTHTNKRAPCVPVLRLFGCDVLSSAFASYISFSLALPSTYMFCATYLTLNSTRIYTHTHIDREGDTSQSEFADTTRTDTTK